MASYRTFPPVGPRSTAERPAARGGARAGRGGWVPSLTRRSTALLARGGRCVHATSEALGGPRAGAHAGRTPEQGGGETKAWGRSWRAGAAWHASFCMPTSENTPLFWETRPGRRPGRPKAPRAVCSAEGHRGGGRVSQGASPAPAARGRRPPRRAGPGVRVASRALSQAQKTSTQADPSLYCQDTPLSPAS